MSEEQQNEGAVDGSENGQQAGAEQEGGGQQEGQEQDAGQLGDAGQRALDAMKAERKAAKDAERAAVTALAELHDKTPAEIRAAIKGGTLAEVIGKPAAAAAGGQQQPDVNKLVAQAKREALADANLRILRAEVRAAAAGKLADPADALTMLDLSKFEVGDNGEVDPGEIADAIGELVSRKPYLAANASTTTFGKADSGVRGGKPPSLDEQIATAEKAGNYTLARQLKSQMLAALNQ